MYKYLLSALAAFALLLTSCSSSVDSGGSPPLRPSVSDNAMVVWSEDFHQTMYVSCSEEAVDVTGTIRFAQKDGVLHANLSNIVGEGSLGNTYHGGAVQNENYKEEGAGHTVYSVTVTMTAPGGIHFRYVYRVHYHWDANGNVVVDYTTSEADCNPESEE